jgi:hypothetical protein
MYLRQGETPMARQAQHGKKATAKQTAATKAALEESASIEESAQDVSPEERMRMIAEAAYLIAEQRGFQGDMALNDWLQAEAEVDARFAARH